MKRIEDINITITSTIRPGKEDIKIIDDGISNTTTVRDAGPRPG
jgi:hypothetical protein